MTKEQLLEIIKSDKKGFYIGNRMILPFKCTFLKLIADNKIFTEFVGSDDIKIAQGANNTSIYFRETGRLSRFEGGYESIKLLIASQEADLTEKDEHIRVICHILADREVEFELPGEDDLFIV